jgi:hypothetical protein
MAINLSTTSNDVTIRIGSIDDPVGFDQARQNIKKTGDDAETMRERMNTSFDKIKTNWLAVTAAITAIAYALKKAWDLMERAAQFEEVRMGLNALSSQYNMTADAAIRLAQVASGGQLSMQRAGELAAKAFTLGLNPEQMKTFIEQAERLTDVLGGDIPKAFEAMEMAAATGRSKGLVQYGIIIDLNRVLKEYADKHGIAKDSISEEMAMQIRANAIMEVAREKISQMGEAIDSTADKTNRLWATFEDRKLMIGQFIPRIVAGIVGLWHEIGVATAYTFAQLADTLAVFMGLIDKTIKTFRSVAVQMDNTGLMGWIDKRLPQITAFSESQKQLNEAAASQAAIAIAAQKKADDSFSVMIASTKDLAMVQTTKGKPAMDGYTESVYNLGKKMKETEAEKFKEALFRDIDMVRRANEEKARESERMLEQFFKDEEARKEKEIKIAMETSQEILRINKERLEALRADEEYHYQVKAEQFQIFQDFMNQAGGGELGANLGNLAATGKGEDQYTQEIERANRHYADMVSLNQGYWNAITLNAQAAAERDEQIRQATTMRTLSTTSSAFGAMAGMAKAYYAASGNESSKAYKLYKVFSKAQIAVDTAKAAIAAYQAMSGIPYIGPVLGVIAAAAAIMYGKAQMDAVDKAEPGGASISSAGGGSAGYPSSATAPSSVFDNTKAETTKSPPMINVHIYGDVVDHDQFARTLIPSLTKAMEDKVQ